MPLFLPNSNPLAYPCGVAPGFDPTHPAANGNVVYSCIASGGGLFNITRARRGTIGGSPTAGITSIGPATNYPAGATTTLALTGIASPTGATLASIFFTPSSFATARTIMYNSGKTGFRILTTGTLAAIINNNAGGNQNSSLILSASTPYFAAVSFANASTCNYVLANLATGQILYQSTTTPNTTPGSAGTWYFGCNDVSANQFIGGIATWVWIDNLLLDINSLIAWAYDPWSFWYPRKLKYYVPGISSFLLAADVSSFVMVGNGLLFNTTMPEVVGTMALVGNPTVFNTTLPPTTGSFTFTGQDVGAYNITLSSATGALALAGNTTTFNTTLPLAVSSFTLTGQDIGAYSISLSTATAGYSLTGQQSTFNTTFASAVGSFTQTGQAATCNTTFTGLSPGSFTYTGYDVLFVLAGSFTITPAVATFILNGNAATFHTYRIVPDMTVMYELRSRSVPYEQRSMRVTYVSDLVAADEPRYTPVEKITRGD